VRHTLVNSGTISGEDRGVIIEARGQTSIILNSGTIAGGDAGIDASFTSNAILEVWNTGTISGSNFSFHGNDDDGSGFSSDRVHNAGLMQGDILLNSGNDLYDGIGGIVLGTVDGGSGNDTLIGGNDTEVFLGGDGEDQISGRGGDDEINGGANNDTLRGGAGNDDVSGGSGADQMFGGEGADTLSGGTNDDVIRGGDGNDQITGGSGGDKLIGGAGADTFIYTSAAQSPFGGGLDIIRDFTSGEDQIDLSDIVGPDLTFIGTGSFSGTQGEVRYVTNAKGNASVFADVDGDGTADLRIFLVNVQSLDQGDFLL
jgi:Ca2+-binding RTX toxin-like protein